ncbi:MAG: SDR family NAD(P)-dependent oxidoreductase [Candidatus Parcubacteria bacterium]|nr:SDR family NAD(P)-dependent oxidoreductase [Burkholderiales bacterium]
MDKKTTPPAARKRLAIVGYAFRFPGPGAEGFWAALCEGRNLVTTVDASRWSEDSYHHPRESEPGTAYTRAGGTLGDVSGFDAAFFGISPREAARMDPQQRLLLELTWEALEAGGIRPSKLRGSRCGVLVGFSGSDYGYRGAEDLAAVDSFSMTGITASIAANRISYAFDLRGPSMAVDTACSSSLVAFHQACQSILSGDSDIAITGAVNLHLHPLAYIAFSKASMLSQEGSCKAFDASGDGYVRSEGGAIMVLKPLEAALADGNRIYAVVAGSGLNCDGKTNGITVPSPEAQAALLSEVYERAGIEPAQIDYVEAHGTGTAVGDPIEARALGEALGKRRPASSPLRIGSVKSNLGHLETAAGMAGMVKALLCLEHRAVPRSIHFETPNPRIAFSDLNICVVTEQTALDPVKRLIIGINSFGFGGANAHVILESAPRPSAKAAARAAGAGGLAETAPARLEERERNAPLFVSARSPSALKAAALRHAEWIREREDLPYYDIAYSAAFHRDSHAHRAIAFGHDRASVANALEAFARDDDTRNVAAGRALANPRGPVFVYSGNGAQWAGMGGKLLAESPVFRQAVSAVNDLVLQHSDLSVLEVLAGGAAAAQRLEATEIAQPALFAVQVGITEMLAAWGLRPTAVAGHSVGEMAAAWACGALSLNQAAYLVCERSAWQGTTRGAGAMTAVGTGAQQLEPLIASLDSRVTIAAINSPGSATVAGAREDLDILEAALQSHGIRYQRLALDYAFHSHFLDAIKDGVEGALRKIAPGPARIPYYSTVSGKQVPGESLDSNYWWRNIRDPVQFGPTVAQMLQAGESIFVEIGPHPILRGYLNECLRAAAADGRVLTTLSRTADGAQQLRLKTFEAVIAGAQVELGAQFPEERRFVDLPGYPWQRERHWLAPSGEGSDLVNRRPVHPLLGYRLDRDEFQWESHLDTCRVPAYADHVVGGEVILPAAAYVEMALAAAFELDPGAPRDIEDLEIRAPLALSEQHSQSVRFLLDPVHGNFTVKSRERMSDDIWRIHATGRLAGASPGAGPQPLRHAATRFEPPVSHTSISADTHYRLARAVGLEYGPAFRAVGEAWLDTAGKRPVVAAALTTPASLEDQAGQAHLHPSYLDAAFQLLLHLFEESAAGDIAFVPVRIGRMSLLKPHVEACFAQVTVTRRGPRSLVADCVLYGQDCEPVALLREVRFRAVQLRESALAGLSALHTRAIPSPLPSTTRRAALPMADRLIAACSGRLHASARQQSRWRYFNDVEPLLEALLSAFAAAAQKQLRSEAPEEAREQALQRLAKLAGDDLLTEPEALWSQLLGDYPDHASEILWIGRLGMHLADIVRGTATPERFLPQPDGADGDAWSAPWMPATTDYARAIADLVDLALAALPPGRRLRVLAINAEHSPAVANVLAGFDPDRFDLVVAGGDYGRNLEGPFDLVLVEDGLASAASRESALHDLRLKTAEDGLLVLLERHPSRAVLLAVEFLAPGSEARPRVRPLAPDIWHAELARQGFQQAMVIEDVPGIEESSYVLIARAIPFADASRRSEGGTNAAEPRRWLLVADKAGPGSRIATDVAADLRGRGHSVALLHSDPVSRAAWEALLDSPLTAQGGMDAIVHLCGLAEARQTPEKTFRRQAGRCESLAGLLAACSGLAVKPDCWAVTARAASALLPSQVRASQRLSTSADEAAFWGFARSAINEHPDLALRLVDLALPEEAQRAAALVEALLQPDAEDEMILTPVGRFVPRMDSAPFARRAALDPQQSFLRLELPASGQLKNLQWTRRPTKPPAEGEVAIDVRAAGLNFRDVMYAMGQLSDEALEGGFAGPTLGMEVAGVVAALGKGVKGLSVGDEVIAFTPAGFATRAVTRAGAVLKKPAAWSFEAAATVQTTFFTAYYALHHLARIAPGERVLVHGAAGGVGLAAIQIAQLKGAEVFATAGSEAKRDLLRLLGVKHVFDSRSLAFADEILARTGGQGVDLVLNSLAGEAMQRSLQVLRPMGRFLELGKRDFYENTPVGLRPFRNNISYFGVDADQLMLERPELTRNLMQELMALFEERAIHPLPYRAFRAQDAVSAFRFMQQSRHIGKVVLGFESAPNADADTAIDEAPQRRLALPAQATYLVTGGTRGFGLRTAQWLAARGARHLVLAGRSEDLDPETQEAIDALRAQGVEVKAARCDVTDRAVLQSLFAEMRESMPPLRGVVHASAVIHDGLIRNLDRERIEAVLAPKLMGAANLHRLTRKLKLDFFVLYSSATTVFGNPGQASYVAANRYLEVLAEERRARGLPALCVGWGPIDDAGYLARNKEIKARLESRLGGSSFAATQALDALEQMLLENISGIAVVKFDRAGLSRFLASARSPKYLPLVAHAGQAAQAASSVEDLRRWVTEAPESEVLPVLTGMLKKEIAEILRMDAAKIDAAASLQDLGLDSLMGVELMTAVEARFGANIPVMALAEVGTIERLVRRIIKDLTRGKEAARDDPQAAIAEQIRWVAAQHAGEVGQNTVDEFAAEFKVTAK